MTKKMIGLIGCFVACSSTFAECTVPENLNDKDMLAEIVTPYSKDNPMAGQLFKMRFFKDGEYHYRILKDDAAYTGTYTYAVVDKNIAVITAAEKFNHVPVEYTMTMVCDDQKTGHYIYQQTKGINGVRSNAARYYLTD